METVWQRRRESRASPASHGMGGPGLWLSLGEAPGQAGGAGAPGDHCLLWERELTRV